MKNELPIAIYPLVKRFLAWLEKYGEISQDQYDFWAFPFGQFAKSVYYRNPWLGIFLVGPFLFLDSFFPGTRRWFWKPQRFPIADAHFAMGFAYLYRATGEERYYRRAVHFLEVLKQTRCSGYQHYCWGYPFDWMTKGGKSHKNTPLITTVPYVYEAFAAVHQIDRDVQWEKILRSIAEHVANDYADVGIKKDVFVCSYAGTGKIRRDRYRHIVNANAYRAFMLTEAARRFDSSDYLRLAQGNLNFVLDAQQPDGSWYYATDGTDQFVDHFHTCFVLKNLIKIENLTGEERIQKTIDKGLNYYKKNLVDEQGLPRPFAKTPRVTLYRRELYDYAESVNLALLARDFDGEMGRILAAALHDLAQRWQEPAGYFRTRKLFIGWNRVPYHRWAQSQLFRSLSLYLLQEKIRKTNHRQEAAHVRY